MREHPSPNADTDINGKESEIGKFVKKMCLKLTFMKGKYFHKKNYILTNYLLGIACFTNDTSTQSVYLF